MANYWSQRRPRTIRYAGFIDQFCERGLGHTRILAVGRSLSTNRCVDTDQISYAEIAATSPSRSL